MAKTFEPAPVTGPINCACLIHGDAYGWEYVDRLYSMLDRHITEEIHLHVYTEAARPVPAPYIKHSLEEWGISGPKRSWWYKMQLFNPHLFSGPLLYFDLDTVVLENIDWIWRLPTRYFWAVQDFKFLWRPAHQGMNSSVMWWDTRRYEHVWQGFQRERLSEIIKKYPGDQDYINQALNHNDLRFLDPQRIKSWRWQCLDGGFNFRKRTYLTPGSGTVVPTDTSVLIFHGKPKPKDLTDPVILQHWR
jgi:hypothetical protein